MIIKPFFKSLTIDAALLTVMASTVVAIAPFVAEYLTEINPESAAFYASTSKLITQVGGVLGLTGGVGSIIGRFNVGDIYTPNGVPGPDKAELVTQEKLDG